VRPRPTAATLSSSEPPTIKEPRVPPKLSTEPLTTKDPSTPPKLLQKQLGSKSEQNASPRATEQRTEIHLGSELHIANNRFRFFRKSTSFDSKNVKVEFAKEKEKEKTKEAKGSDKKDNEGHIRLSPLAVDSTEQLQGKYSEEKREAKNSVDENGRESGEKAKTGAAQNKFRHLRRSLSVDNLIEYSVGGMLTTKTDDEKR
jgi:hypothetical protein